MTLYYSTILSTNCKHFFGYAVWASISYRWIWKLPGPQKFGLFIWLCDNSSGRGEMSPIRFLTVLWTVWTTRNPSVINWVKMNTDGAAKGNPGLSSFGGVIRNSIGGWELGFMGKISYASNLVAELWAIREGLQIAWEFGYRHLIVESDSTVALQLLTSQDTNFHPADTLVRDCKALICRQWAIKLQHVFREANQVADGLANLISSNANSLYVLTNPQVGLKTPCWQM
ncbi:hypothetical protein Scep_023629 [Stephania cephalantha]|uniref:RNase H type-1 domain-containing protein n=1 Tax=Stephania cephalantha TaxID=152367 RepID=A0AAP0HXK6_9MAGN